MKSFGKQKGVLIVAIIFVMLAVLSVGCTSAKTIEVPSLGNETIQKAVNNATAGDTIIVKDGTYNENVDVNVNNLTILSENGSASTIVQAADSNDHAFNVTADWVTISGFTVRNATAYRKAGISLNDAEHCTISENTASNNDNGIYLSSSSNNTIANNTANSNISFVGILVSSSSNNTLSDNTASNNHAGIFLETSSSNNLTGNTASNNSFVGIFLETSSSNNLTGNTASDNIWGIYLSSSSTNNVTGNNVSDNTVGIGLYESSNNNISGNTANSNNNDGIALSSSSTNNRIYNNYFDNTNNAIDYGNNIWNITAVNGTNIIGGDYLGGNYWSDYTGYDTDGDGLGDTPYDIPGGTNKDYLPLVPKADYTLTGLLEIIEDLPDDVLSDEIKNSLVSKVENALKSVDKEKDEAAINMLGAFINEIEAQRGKKISEEVADMLIAYANHIIAKIEAG